MSTIKLFRKSVVERRRLFVSYDCWLEELESLSGYQVQVAPYTADAPLGVSVGYTDVNNRKVVMFASGGKANTTYTIQLIATTNLSQVKRDDIGLRVTP